MRHWRDKIADAQTVRRRTAGKRLVWTNGCFDLFHRGHADLLWSARALGDVLVVGINSDDSVRINKGPRRPILGQEDRACTVASLECVDFVVVFDWVTPEAELRALSPEVLVKGGDWEGKKVAGSEYAGRLVFLPLTDGRSSTGIIKQIQTRQNSGVL